MPSACNWRRCFLTLCLSGGFCFFSAGFCPFLTASWKHLGREGVGDPHDEGMFAINGDFSEIPAAQRYIEGYDFTAYSYLFLEDTLPISRYIIKNYDEVCFEMMKTLSEHGFKGDISDINEIYTSESGKDYIIYALIDESGNQNFQFWDDIDRDVIIITDSSGTPIDDLGIPFESND